MAGTDINLLVRTQKEGSGEAVTITFDPADQEAIDSVASSVSELITLGTEELPDGIKFVLTPGGYSLDDLVEVIKRKLRDRGFNPVVSR